MNRSEKNEGRGVGGEAAGSVRRRGYVGFPTTQEDNLHKKEIDKRHKWLMKAIERNLAQNSRIKDWIMEEKDGKTQKKMGNWSDLEGIRKKKKILDEKYADIDMKLGSKSAKREKKHRKNTLGD